VPAKGMYDTLIHCHTFSLPRLEADGFLSEIPVMGEWDDEPQGEITDHLFTDPDSDLGTLVPNHPTFSIDDLCPVFHRLPT